MAVSKPSATHPPVSSDGSDPGDRIPRPNLSEQVAARLRNDIVHRRIPPGTHLIQDELCTRFGTSRMPVRDALQQLTHEGMLEQHGPRRVVVSLGAEDMEDVHTIVAVLHGWAAGRAALVASDREIAELAAVSKAALNVEEPYGFGRLAMDFHRRLNLMAHSGRLIRTLVTLHQTAPRIEPFNVPDAMPSSKAGHEGIVAALRARDVELAERRTRDNALQYVDLLLRSLRGLLAGRAV